MLHAAQEESGGDEQHQGDRDLRHDQDPPGELMFSGDTRGAVRWAIRDAGAEAVQRGDETDEQTSQRRESGGERERRVVDRDRADPR